jgi:hypothetical protein
LNIALSATIFLAASFASAGPSIALSMASRRAANFVFSPSMPPAIAPPSSSAPGSSLWIALILSRAPAVSLRRLS